MLFLSEQSKEPVDSWSGMAVDFSTRFSPVSRARKGFARIASAQSSNGKCEAIKSEENIDDPVHRAYNPNFARSTRPHWRTLSQNSPNTVIS